MIIMKNIIVLLLFTAFLVPATSAELTIPRFELATLGRSIDGEFSLNSSVSADLEVTGGYKYGLTLGFTFDSYDLVKALAYRNFTFGHLSGSPGNVTIEDYNNLVDQVNERMNNQGTLHFRIIKATIRDLFNIPLELGFFIGDSDDFCSGDEFVTRFGNDSFGTDYRGLFYFPNGIAGDITRRYNGIYGVRGTGVSLALSKWDMVIPMVYVYQNFSPFSKPGIMGGTSLSSIDARFLINHPKIKAETFAGFSHSKDDGLMLRGGLLGLFGAGNDIQFLIQGGLSGWEVDKQLTIDNFYFLMEPRFTFGMFNLYGTLFFHPVIYHNIPSDSERGKMDLNLKFFFHLPQSGFVSGVESNLGFNVKKMEEFSFKISPFFSFIGSGIRWDTKLRVNVLEVDNPGQLLELFLGIQTAF